MLFSELYHQQSKHTGTKKPNIQPESAWPEEWKTVTIKTYPRFPKVALPVATNLNKNIGTVLDERTSVRSFKNTITRQSLSNLLSYALGEKPSSTHRRYPSAGGRYPLEFYLLILRPIESIEVGIYHYNCHDHDLTRISDLNTDKTFLSSLALDNHLQNAQLAIATTAAFARARIKYGERSYRFALLEAGGAGQNLSLVATDLNIGSLYLGGTIDTEIEKLLDVDGVEESLVSFMCFG